MLKMYFDANKGTGSGAPPEPPASTPPAGGDDGNTPEPVPYERFKAQNAQLKAAQAELATLQAAQKAATEKQLADDNKWKELAEQREKELASMQINLQRQQVAAAHNLPADLAARLQGTTPEEMAEDAKALAALVKQPAPGTPPPPNGGPPQAITAAQLADPKWVRENAATLLEAAQNGRL